MVAAKLFIST